MSPCRQYLPSIGMCAKLEAGGFSMKKRYWMIGGLLLYAVIRQAGVTDHDTVPVRPPPSSETISKPVTGSRLDQTGTSKLKVDPVFHAPSPATSTEPTQKPEPPRTNPLRLVRGQRVALRAGPSVSNAILDRFDEGRQVLLIEHAGDWSRVQDQMTRQEGWMASRFLAEQNKTTEDRPDEKSLESEKTVNPAPAIPDSVVIQRIIAESLKGYPGSCPCPYNKDRGGRRCGKRSAYSKPRGYAPICFPQDVSKAMIEAFSGR